MPAAGRAEEAGDLGDGFAAGFDVAHGGAGVLVPGLGHDVLRFRFDEIRRQDTNVGQRTKKFCGFAQSQPLAE